MALQCDCMIIDNVGHCNSYGIAGILTALLRLSNVGAYRHGTGVRSTFVGPGPAPARTCWVHRATRNTNTMHTHTQEIGTSLNKRVCCTAIHCLVVDGKMSCTDKHFTLPGN
jgi:hypothetical protein